MLSDDKLGELGKVNASLSTLVQISIGQEIEKSMNPKLCPIRITGIKMMICKLYVD